MTTIGVFISWTFVAVATGVLICLVIFYGHRRGERGFRSWALRLSEIFIAFIAWQILFVILILVTYTGGSAEEIFFKDAVCNIAAYLVVIVILIFLENKHLSSLKPVEE
ncbi:MAG: hypothetical protein RTS72_07685 [Candidatus Thorarchaeota archaeon]